MCRVDKMVVNAAGFDIELQWREYWFLPVVFVQITSYCRCVSMLFLCFSGYAGVNRMRVRLLSSSCRMWSSEIIMLYQSAWELTIPSFQPSR